MAAKKEENAKVKLPTAKKRDIQNEKRRLENRAFKAKVRTSINTFEKALQEKDPSIKEKLNTVYSLMDKGVKTNKFSLNKASRIKSKLSLRSKSS